MAGMVNVHVSSVSIVEQGLSISSLSEQRSHSDSPLVAISAVVSAYDPAVCYRTPITAIETAILTRSHLRLEGVPSACMEAVMQHFQAAGISEEVPGVTAAPRRHSSNCM